MSLSEAIEKAEFFTTVLQRTDGSAWGARDISWAIEACLDLVAAAGGAEFSLALRCLEDSWDEAEYQRQAEALMERRRHASGLCLALHEVLQRAPAATVKRLPFRSLTQAAGILLTLTLNQWTGAQAQARTFHAIHWGERPSQMSAPGAPSSGAAGCSGGGHVMDSAPGPQS